MSELILIKFRVTDKFYGYPDPFIPNGSVVILIQDGILEIARYNEPTDDTPIPSFDHPKELSINKELANGLFNIIKEKYPQYLLSEVAVTLTCPSYIADKVLW